MTIRRTRLFFVVSVALAISAASVSAQQQWGSLKIQFLYDGKPPASKQIPVQGCRQLASVADESLIVSAAGGIQNVVVYAYQGRGGIELPAIHPELAAAPPATVLLDNKKCRFEPHIAICRTGDTLKVMNSDPVGHNVNLHFLANQAANLTIAPGKFVQVPLPLAEPAPTPTECNIHPWMQAKVIVFDNAYVAKSSKEGVLEIENLPTGKLALRIFHERANRLSGLKVGGEAVDRRNVFEVNIEEGLNDIGTVKISSALFGN